MFEKSKPLRLYYLSSLTTYTYLSIYLTIYLYACSTPSPNQKTAVKNKRHSLCLRMLQQGGGQRPGTASHAPESSPEGRSASAPSAPQIRRVVQVNVVFRKKFPARFERT